MSEKIKIIICSIVWNVYEIFFFSLLIKLLKEAVFPMPITVELNCLSLVSYRPQSPVKTFQVDKICLLSKLWQKLVRSFFFHAMNFIISIFAALWKWFKKFFFCHSVYQKDCVKIGKAIFSTMKLYDQHFFHTLWNCMLSLFVINKNDN